MCVCVFVCVCVCVCVQGSHTHVLTNMQTPNIPMKCEASVSMQGPEVIAIACAYA